MSAYPVYEKHPGAWEGAYTLMDRDGNILDHHRSRVEIRRAGNRRFQRNVYTWDDGRTETLEFSSEQRDGKSYVESPRLKGWSQEVGDDTIILLWVYKDRPHNKMSEIIRLIDDRHRARVWQFIEDGVFTKVMLIEEHKVADSVE